MGDKEDIIGFTAGNDVSCRDIEGENSLYLSQAKIYKGCCALGSSIATSSSICDPRNLSIECKVTRNEQNVFEGKTNTSFLKRSLEELAAYLCRDNPVPLGTVFLTGTGIVPPDEFALNQGDIVEISIEGIGTLRNPVVQL